MASSVRDPVLSSLCIFVLNISRKLWLSNGSVTSNKPPFPGATLTGRLELPRGPIDP